jgi:PAS domain S-box-containing protein
MFGYSRDEMVGLNVGHLSCDLPQYSEAEAQRWLQRTAEEGMQVVEWLARRKNGEEFWVEVALQRTEIGGKGRILAVLRDVDARKRMEEQLRQSEKMEAVGQLAGGIAHDFNNQLAGIVGYADLIRSELRGDDDVSDNLDRILVAARRASDLTTQLLAFARKGKYESIAVDVHLIVEEVISLLRRSIDKRIIIERRLNANPQLATGDPTQLQGAILNLALNARDAMPDGGTLTLATRNIRLAAGDEACERDEIPPGEYVEVSVADTGLGMDSETQQHIFEPFFTRRCHRCPQRTRARFDLQGSPSHP